MKMKINSVSVILTDNVGIISEDEFRVGRKQKWFTSVLLPLSSCRVI